MTNIELQTMEAVKRAAYAFTNKEIDWEQRRYELAKSAISGVAASDYSEELVAKFAVRYADAVIRELKSQHE